MQQRPHKDETYTWDETYTFAENLFLAYERTGDRKYFDLGKRYLWIKGFFDPLAEGQNVLPGLHAYSHVNALRFRHPRISEAGRREVFPSGPQCGGHDFEGSELRHRRLGTQ